MLLSAPPAALATQLLTSWEHNTRLTPDPSIRTQFLQDLTSLCQVVTAEPDANIDADDVQAVMHTYPTLRIGSTTAAGTNRAEHLARAAVQQAQLQQLGPDPTAPASRVLLAIASPPTAELEMDELTTITEYIQRTAAPTAEVTFGHAPNPALKELRLLLLLSYGPPLTPLPLPKVLPHFLPEQVFSAAVRLITEYRKVSSGFLQRHLRLGYNRTRRLLDELAAAGIIRQREDGWWVMK